MEDKSILLVDDEEDIRLVLGISLADMGYKVFTAENGREALRIFREHKPPIVVTDIKMPDIDGVDLLRKIKAENPDTEVVMITGHGDMEVAVRSFKYEASDFITKPINVDALENALVKVREKIITRQKLREYTAHLESLVYEKSTRLAEVQQLLQSGQLDLDLGDLQERFRRLFDDMPCYLTVVDREYRITAVNKKYREDFGEQVGTQCYQASRQRIKKCPECPVEKTFHDGGSYQAEIELVQSNGKTCETIVWSSPVRDETGQTTHAVIMCTDTSHILGMQDHLATLGLMVGSISHGIKGLLTGLDGGMYLLDSGLKKDNEDQMKEGLEIVKLMAGRIRNMVLDILLFSKERDLSKKEMDVLEFAEDMIRSIESKAQEHAIEIVSEFGQNLGKIVADQGFLRTAMINILENAVDACVEDRAKADHFISLKLKQDDRELLIEIGDNGIGMDQDTQDRVFELFFSNKGQKGTGLGLFITHRIVNQHGGDIRVASTLGRGSVFYVTIPVRGPATEEAAQAGE